MVKKIIQNYLVTLVALWVATMFLTGFRINQDWQTYGLAALVLMLAYFFVRPLLNLVSFPINIVTLGFFSYVINVLLLYLTVFVVRGIALTDGKLTFDKLGVLSITLPDIELSKILTLIVASLIISFVNWLLHKLVF